MLAMSDLTRRAFLKFIGTAGAIASMGSLAMPREAHGSGLWFTPVRVPSPSALPVNHSGVGSAADAGGNLVGVFGNNWMLFIPTLGPFAGVHVPFAIGPTRCELTGPTFVGHTLVLSVQHPGEDSPARGALAANPTFLRTGLELLTVDGSGVFPQDRTVPVGSQWPGNIAKDPTDIARPAVIGIQRKQRSWREPWEADDD
jgi:Bacterial protein of unknown function (DUF839)